MSSRLVQNRREAEMGMNPTVPGLPSVDLAPPPMPRKAPFSPSAEAPLSNLPSLTSTQSKPPPLLRAEQAARDEERLQSLLQERMASLEALTTELVKHEHGCKAAREVEAVEAAKAATEATRASLALHEAAREALAEPSRQAARQVAAVGMSGAPAGGGGSSSVDGGPDLCGILAEQDAWLDR